ncbi:MAG: response regulator transcription factor [Candidatus Eremiobacterota bacterium]
MKIILIDDDDKLLNLLDEYLSANELEVYKANSGLKGLEMIKKEKFDIAVLDVMMPGLDGIETLKEIMKSHSYLPVIMLTARGDETDRIIGLEVGADDYMAKPFSPRELLARIKAVTRRKKKINRDEEIIHDLIELDTNKREAIFNGKPVELTGAEFDILTILVQNKGMVLSRDRIMDLARGKDFMAFDRSIDVHISHLRQKLEKDPKNPEIIKTIWGIGYLYSGE